MKRPVEIEQDESTRPLRTVEQENPKNNNLVLLCEAEPSSHSKSCDSVRQKERKEGTFLNTLNLICDCLHFIIPPSSPGCFRNLDGTGFAKQHKDNSPFSHSSE